VNPEEAPAATITWIVRSGPRVGTFVILDATGEGLRPDAATAAHISEAVAAGLRDGEIDSINRDLGWPDVFSDDNFLGDPLPEPTSWTESAFNDATMGWTTGWRTTEAVPDPALPDPAGPCLDDRRIGDPTDLRTTALVDAEGHRALISFGRYADDKVAERVAAAAAATAENCGGLVGGAGPLEFRGAGAEGWVASGRAKGKPGTVTGWIVRNDDRIGIVTVFDAPDPTRNGADQTGKLGTALMAWLLDWEPQGDS